jgi:hypothetical protein
MMTEERPADDLSVFITAAEAHLDHMRDLIEGSDVFIRTSDHRDVIFGAHLSNDDYLPIGLSSLPDWQLTRCNGVVPSATGTEHQPDLSSDTQGRGKGFP